MLPCLIGTVVQALRPRYAPASQEIPSCSASCRLVVQILPLDGNERVDGPCFRVQRYGRRAAVRSRVSRLGTFRSTFPVAMAKRQCLTCPNSADQAVHIKGGQKGMSSELERTRRWRLKMRTR